MRASAPGPQDDQADPADRARVDVVVVGAGAAGLATAIFVCRRSPHAAVRVVDTAKKPGAKILISGGGRCNVTNVAVSETDYWGGRRTIVRKVLRALPVAETIEFFRGLGVSLHEEADGKLFPDSNRARDVLDALLAECASLGVRVDADRRVVDIRRAGDAFLVETVRGTLHARHVVLATGGRSLPKTGSDGSGLAIAARLGHTIVPTTPALAPLLLDGGGGSPHDALSGVAVDGELSVWIDGAVTVRLRGALLWTHFGVSGPLALNASRHWERARVDGRDVRVTLSLCPGETFDAVDRRLTRAARDRPRATVAGALGEWLPASVVAAIVRAAELPADLALAQLSRDGRRRVVRALVEWPLPIAGTRGYAFAEATAGGVDLREIDPRTMESRVCPGLVLVGEMLDVDGRIGGFNFQWAWASAAAAARGLAQRLAAPSG